jgi:putative transposase
MSDSLLDSKRYRLLNIIDDFKRDALNIVTDISVPTIRIIRALEELTQDKEKPEMIRVDNGPEFISDKLDT